MTLQTRPIPTGKVVFLEEPHVYLNEKNQRYLSTTQLLEKFKEKKDWRAIAEKASNGFNPKYMGRSVEDILEAWNQSGASARVRGTAFHKGKEDDHIKQALTDQPITFIPNAKMIIPEEDAGVMTDYRELPDGEYSELILWSHKWHLAGIADKVIVDGDYFDIEDYKTNKSIDKVSFFERGVGYKMMQFPLNDVMDCSFNHYELQLSIYAYMFAELSGKIPRNLTILHHPSVDTRKINEDGNVVIEKVVTEKETRYPCQYKKHTIMLMFNFWGGFAPPDYIPTNNQ